MRKVIPAFTPKKRFLQWGKSPAGGGNSWALASWLVSTSGDAFRTQTLVEVQPGTVLTGVMRMLSLHSTWSFWICEFVGYPDTGMSVNVTGQLVMPVQTLEAYTVQECRDYPATLMTSMRAIGVNTASGALATSFKAFDSINDCGQHAEVVSNETGSGQVDLYYSRQFISLSPAAVASVSRSRDQVDLFAVGSDGSVNSTFWNPAGDWFGRWYRIADSRFGDQFTIPPGSPISVLSRFPEHLDLFAVGRDAAVYTTFWNASGGWPNTWFRLADTNFSDGFKVPPGSQVTSLARAPDLIDLFVAGFDGGVYTFWNVPGGWFNRWVRLGDDNFWDNFTVPPGTPIAAISRFPEHLDLFASGRDGHVYSTFWDASSGWSGRWFWLGDVNFGDQFTVPPGSPVTALSRFRDQIELFVSGRDGAIYYTFWNAGSGGWHNHWFRLADDQFWDNFTVPAGSPVTAISRVADHLDLFVSGRDGGVYSTFWDGSSGWSNRWLRLGDARFWDGFTIPPGVRVTAQSRDPNVIDLFVTGRDNRVYSTFWTAERGWLGEWFGL